MFVNTAGSIVPIKKDVDYTPEWISTSPHLHEKTADAGNGPGYWDPPIAALHTVVAPGAITLWTLKGNTRFRTGDLHAPQRMAGGTLPKATYYYRLAIVQGSYYSFPSKPIMINTVGIEGTIKISWNHVVGAEGYVLFRGIEFGTWGKMIELPLTTRAVIDDGSAAWVVNTITDFGIPVAIPANAFTVGHVYNMWFRKYTGSVDDCFLGYRPANYPPEL